MSNFSSILNQVKHKSSSPGPFSRPPSATGARKSTTASSDASSMPINAVPKDFVRPTTVDPAVARLKEARRLQKEKEEAARKRKNPSKTTKSGGTSKAVASANTIRRKQLEKQEKMKQLESTVYRPRSQSPVKKLSYTELMAQAKQKGKALIETSKSPPPKETHQEKPSGYRSKSTILKKPQQPKSRPPAPPPPRTAPIARPPPKPKPMAKPSAKLQAKLIAKKKSQQDRLRAQMQRRGSYEEDVSDEGDGYDSGDLSDDFIVHDDGEEGYDDEEEEDQEEGYDRDEIWKMFNRGKSRRDFDREEDDLSDMEVTGAQLEREEMLAAKRAKEEDLREQERERRHKLEKRRRLGK